MESNSKHFFKIKLLSLVLVLIQSMRMYGELSYLLLCVLFFCLSVFVCLLCFCSPVFLIAVCHTYDYFVSYILLSNSSNFRFCTETRTFIIRLKLALFYSNLYYWTAKVYTRKVYLLPFIRIRTYRCLFNFMFVW